MAADVSSSTIPLQRRDRPWVDADVTVLCGPFLMPGIGDLRAAVGALADRYPSSRLTWSLDPTRSCWRNDRRTEDIVVEGDWDNTASIGAALDAMERDRSLAPPLALVRYPDYIGLKMSHGVGDGRLFLSIISAVLRTAITGDVCEWLPEPMRLSPLGEAAFRTFVRHPALIKRAIDDRIEPPSADRPVQPQIQPWAPARRTIHVPMSRARADELILWGQQFAPKASRFAILVSLVLKAMRYVGLDIADDTRVIVDLRRYLGWRYIDGNFVAGVPMNLRPDMSPERVSATMKATTASGRPLANQILTSLRQRGASWQPPVSSFDRSSLPRPTFTNMGRSPEIDCLPFRTDLAAVYAGSVHPEGPLGITFLFGETPQVMSLNATFHDNVVDATAVHAALNAAALDPIGLLRDPVAMVD